MSRANESVLRFDLESLHFDFDGDDVAFVDLGGALVFVRVDQDLYVGP